MKCESSLVSSVVPVQGKNSNSCCRTLQENWLKNKGAILVLIWSFLCFSVYQYFTLSSSRDPSRKRLTTADLVAVGLLFPIGGWLADAYFGRYRVIRFGMWTMWFGAMMNGFSLVIGKVFLTYGTHGDPWVSFACRVIMGAGFGAFQANIIQFGIDQLMDASSTEIKSFITWYIMSTTFSGITLYFSSYCTPEYVAVLVVAVCLTLAVISNFLLNHWLNKEQVVNNPLPLISKVVYFTMRKKFAKQNMLHVHVEQQGWLSKLNIAKRVYNGPFSSEQVEDVKTFFRVILVMTVFIIACSGIPTVNNVCYGLGNHLQNHPNETGFTGCYKFLVVYYSNYTSAVVVVLVYQIFINPVFHKCIPQVRITTKFFLSVLLFFAGVMTLLGLETASLVQQTGAKQTIVRCIIQSKQTAEIDYYWIVIPSVLNGLSLFLFFISGLEFICAQAPFNMKGLILGLGFALYGLSSLIQTGMSIPFLHSNIWERAPLTCGIWYFMLQGFIVLVGFLIVVAIVKIYKRRTRVNVSSHSFGQESDSYTSE